MGGCRKGQEQQVQGMAESGDVNFRSARDSEEERGGMWGWRDLGQPQVLRSVGCAPALPKKHPWGQAGVRERLNV